MVYLKGSDFKDGESVLELVEGVQVKVEVSKISHLDSIYLNPTRNLLGCSLWRGRVRGGGRFKVPSLWLVWPTTAISARMPLNDISIGI